MRALLLAALASPTLLAFGCGEEFVVVGGGGGHGGSGGTTTTTTTTSTTTAVSCTDASQCDDGNVCTEDRCVAGKCSRTPVAIDDGNACTVDACDPAQGITHELVKIDDDDACTTDGCDPQSGPFHEPIDVDDGDPCTDDTCDPETGQIDHAEIDPDDGDPCTDDYCDEGGVHHDDSVIDDGDACTSDSCDAVHGVQHLPVALDDNNVCTVDTCDHQTGVHHDPVSCDDGNVCTTDSCDPTTGCAHKPAVYFAETFSTSLSGWTTMGAWQIGAAMASGGPSHGFPDPAMDHTPSADNRLAGTAIGGNLVNVAGPPQWLTSPTIDLSTVAGPVYLKYWRWLNLDGPPYMQAFVEVWDGASWTTIWKSQNVIEENSWSVSMSAGAPTVFDVTAYKSAGFRVRFGYQIFDPNAFIESGWNLDDVALLPSASCP